MEVDESGAYNEALGVDHSSSRDSFDWANLGDLSILDADVGFEPGVPGPGDDFSVFDQDVVHVVYLCCGARLGIYSL